MEAKITESVHYIGVNDRRTHRFESLWPIPAGISYNSYLVTGSDKAAIIDGVEVSHALQQIDAIRALLGDRHPDYLIINHMEPDHSGGISILRQAFPDITIVGNAQTLSMVKGFYGLDDNTLAVKDGDTISLGGATLRLALTPLVHWPETMMTYLEEEGVLFAGDAFGCFGALNGAVVDRDMNTAPYFDEMVRYYACIVGKYSPYVQKALAKLQGLDVRTICSTHGPVWHERAAEVIAMYDRLSRYEALDNGVTIVYGSMYGNTEHMAEAAAEGLAGAGVSDITVYNAAEAELCYILADVFRHRGLVVAAPTYSDGLFPPVQAVLEAIKLRGVRDRQVALLGSHTWVPRSTKELLRHLEESQMTLVEEPVTAKQAPAADILDRCRALGRKLAEQLK